MSKKEEKLKVKVEVGEKARTLEFSSVMRELDEAADIDLTSWASHSMQARLAQKRAEGKSCWWHPTIASTENLKERAMKCFQSSNHLDGCVFMLMALRREAAGLVN